MFAGMPPVPFLLFYLSFLRAVITSSGSNETTVLDGAAGEGSYSIAGTQFQYVEQRDSFTSLRMLTAPGPLGDDVTVEVYTV